jgi:hypothetical protein
MFHSSNLACGRPLLLRDLAEGWRGSNVKDASPEWTGYTPGTKKKYTWVLDGILQEYGDAPVEVLEDLRIKQVLTQFADGEGDKPRGSDERLRVLGSLLKFAHRRGFVRFNQLRGRKERGCANSYAHAFWTEQQIIDYRLKADELGLGPAADAVEFMAWTGLFPDQARHCLPSHVLDTSLERGTARGLPENPMLPGARAFIRQLEGRRRQPGVHNLLVTAKGKAWGRSNMHRVMKKVHDAAGIKHVSYFDGHPVVTEITAMDLRKTWAIRLMRNGYSNEDIIFLTRWHEDAVRDLRNLASLGTPKSCDDLLWPEVLKTPSAPSSSAEENSSTPSVW